MLSYRGKRPFEYHAQGGNPYSTLPPFQRRDLWDVNYRARPYVDLPTSFECLENSGYTYVFWDERAKIFCRRRIARSEIRTRVLDDIKCGGSLPTETTGVKKNDRLPSPGCSLQHASFDEGAMRARVGGAQIITCIPGVQIGLSCKWHSRIIGDVHALVGIASKDVMYPKSRNLIFRPIVSSYRHRFERVWTSTPWFPHFVFLKLRTKTC